MTTDNDFLDTLDSDSRTHLVAYLNTLTEEGRAKEIAYQRIMAETIWDDEGQIYCPSADAAPGEVFYWD